ncbi:hypothetical protein CLU79DRAFT_754445 [Phycomyces nitens]|nr:hypothetical protein CLU79DRAFT_754445 [Phycomyces nitens]
MNTPLYHKRKLRSTQHILTMNQIKEIGKLINLSTRNAVELLMTPAKLFLLKKPILAKIQTYLIENGLTNERIPGRNTLIADHARKLIEIIYPGYPAGRAREIGFKEERQGPRRAREQECVAYDHLFTSDLFERQEEVLRVNLNWKEVGHTATACFPAERLVKTGVLHKKVKRDLRLHMYFWLSARLVLKPELESFSINGESAWVEEDTKSMDEGFQHIDITDKVDWDAFPEDKVSENIVLDFEFVGRVPPLKHITICTTWRKTTEELLSQTYMNSATGLISRAMETSQNIDETQRKAIGILSRYPLKERSEVEKAQDIYMSCADIFSGSWTQHWSENGGEDDDIVIGDEFVSAMDPILLSRMEHPARGIYCTHAACFDAIVFYSLVTRMKAWKCPHCFIQIKGIQELYIDYAMKGALMKYPDTERLVLCGGEYLADVDISVSKTSASLEDQDSSDDLSDDSYEDRASKRPRRASVIIV